MIREVEKIIPSELLKISGSVFYSGTNAYNSLAKLYIIGLNPGGDPILQADETIELHTKKVIESMPDDWSAYRDESWVGAKPGLKGMQPRVLHLLDSVGLQAGEVPASNLIFVRSSRESTLIGGFQKLAEICWPVHQYVIDNIKPKVILCFGKKSGSWVCNKLGATVLVDEFVESNNRKWRSQLFTNNSGINVVVATHPSIADWTSPKTDPCCLVKKAFEL